jgi:hypothetical protein
MSITYSSLPSPHSPGDVVRKTGWWHGSGGRKYVDHFVLSGISEPRPPGAIAYYIGSFVESKEGTLQSIGVARFDVGDLEAGASIVSTIRRPYSGRTGDGKLTLSGYPRPAKTAPPPSNSSIGFWTRRQHAEKPDRGNIPSLIDGYVDFLEKHENGDPSLAFMKTFKMPEHREAFYVTPGWAFAQVDPVQPTDAGTLRALLNVAKQRAGVDSPFQNVENAALQACVMSFFCTSYGNSLIYTMDAHRGQMSEWFQSPRGRRTGDCEDVSLDALMIFRSLINSNTISPDSELGHLQKFAKRYKAYMALGSATSASADGVAKNGSHMAHMYVLFQPLDENLPWAIGEGTGYVTPVQAEQYRNMLMPGFTQRGLDYTNSKMPKHLGIFKRCLRGIPSEGKPVVSEFYVHICSGVPHDGSEMVLFLNNKKQIGPLLKTVIGKDSQQFSIVNIPGTARKDLDKQARKYLQEAWKSHEPVPNLVIKGNEPVPDIRSDLEAAVGKAKINQSMAPADSDVKLLYLFDTHRQKDKKKRFFNMLKQDANTFRAVSYIPQVTNDRGEGCFLFSFQLQNGKGDNMPSIGTNSSIGIGGYAF